MRIDMRTESAVNADLGMYVQPVLNNVALDNVIAFDTAERWLWMRWVDASAVLGYRDEKVQLSNGSRIDVLLTEGAPETVARRVAALLGVNVVRRGGTRGCGGGGGGSGDGGGMKQ